MRAAHGLLVVLVAVAVAVAVAACSSPKPPPAAPAPAEAAPTKRQARQAAATQQAAGQPAGQAAAGQAAAKPPATQPAAAPAAAKPPPAGKTAAAPAPAAPAKPAPALAPLSYAGTFQLEDQRSIAQFKQPMDEAHSLQGLWSGEKSQCHKGIALDHTAGYGTFTVDTSPRGIGTFEERLDEVHSIYLHYEWIGRYYLADDTLILLSAADNRIQRTSYDITTYGNESLEYETKGQWTYDLWEGTQLAASTSGAGVLVRCETANITAAYLAANPELAKRVEAQRLEAKARETEANKRETEANKVFQEQKRFDAWLAQKKKEYKASMADNLLNQTPLVSDGGYWIVGSSIAVGIVRLGAVQTTYARMRYQANDQECLKNNVCPEYLLVMRDAEAARMLKQSAEVRALVAKFVGVVNSTAGTPAPIFEPVELYPYASK